MNIPLAAQLGVPLAFRGLEGFFKSRKNRQDEEKEKQRLRLQALIQSLSPQQGATAQPPQHSAPGMGLSMLGGINRNISDPLLRQLLPQLFSKLTG